MLTTSSRSPNGLDPQGAEQLNLTPSAMNRRIQDLEAEVGTPLFERRPGGQIDHRRRNVLRLAEVDLPTPSG